MVKDRDNKEKEFSIGDEATEVEERESAVSQSVVKKKIGLIGLIIVCLFVLYYFFSGDKADTQSGLQKTDEIKEERSISLDQMKVAVGSVAPKEEESRLILPPELPQLPKDITIPDIPKPQKKQELPRIPVTPVLPKVQANNGFVDPPKKNVITKQSRQTPMLVVSGGGVGAGKAVVKSSGINITDPSQILDPNKLQELRESLQGQNVGVTEDSDLQRTPDQKLATRVGDLEYIVAEGKMIDAVLETAINTDLKGKIRAVVSRDVFSESGERVLVPKGSRLIGSYSTEISLIQGRVDVSWTRIILPWGVDVVLSDSPGIGVDQLGRAGVGGIVDNKFFSVMSTSIMLAALRVGTGLVVDKVMGKDDVTVSSARKKGKSSTKDSSATDDAEYKIKASPGAVLAMQAVQDSSNQISDYVKRYSNNAPTIRVNQGTRLKVFVNKDIVFPKSAFRRYQVVN